jgi:uncharacterized repeat protein (TIGR02543 family)
MPIRITYYLEDAYSETVSFVSDFNDYELYVPISKYGHTFIGWYTDSSFSNEFKLADDAAITDNIVLYAKFEDLSGSKIVDTDSINSINIGENHFITNSNYSEVEVFIYSNSSFSAYIVDKYGNIVTYLNDYYTKYTLDLKLSDKYYLLLEYNYSDVYVSYEFSGEATTDNKVNIDINNERYYDFKYKDGMLDGLYIPGHIDFEFVGWYDAYGNLVIDKFGNIYSYNSCDLYARWQEYN